MLEYDAVVVGGGFFGCRIAMELAARDKRILVLESGSELLGRASFVNQARVHGGYHYPRSLLTALRSRVNLPVFTDEFEDCIDQSFDQYYAVSRLLSKVTARQFKLFCSRIDAPVEVASNEVKQLFNSDLVEDVYKVREYAFNARKIRAKLLTELDKLKVDIRLNTSAGKVLRDKLGLVVIGPSGEVIARGRRVINSTYSQINQLNARSGLDIIPLKHELTEMVIVNVPETLRRVGITIMCGPFFSVMPFPALGKHSLSHVRYTPHTEWTESKADDVKKYQHYRRLIIPSAYKKMLADAVRYVPALEGSGYDRSLWEVKTVLPQSEGDDSRPILYKANHGLDGYTCIMGGKIDNIYDVLKEIAN